MLQQQALTRRDFANEGDWEEYQASGMAPRQLEGKAKVVRRGGRGQAGRQQALLSICRQGRCAGPVCRMPLFMQIGCVLACIGSWLRYVPVHATCLHWPPLKLCPPGAPAHLPTHVQRQQQKDASKEKSKIATQLGKVRQQDWLSLAGGRALQ